MQVAAAGHALDRRDLATVGERGKQQTRFHALAVDEDGAGAALAEPASFLRAGEVQVLPQRIEQRRAWVEDLLMLAAIDAQRSRHDWRSRVRLHVAPVESCAAAAAADFGNSGAAASAPAAVPEHYSICRR